MYLLALRRACQDSSVEKIQEVPSESAFRDILSLLFDENLCWYTCYNHLAKVILTCMQPDVLIWENNYKNVACQGNSNEDPQHTVWWTNKKILSADFIP